MTDMAVSVADVLSYLQLNQPGSTAQYNAGTVGSNILSAQSTLEFAIGRYLLDRTFTTQSPWATTTLNAAQVPIFGFRSFSSVTWGGTVMSVAVPGDGNTSPTCWAIPDAQRTGQFVALQFRAWRADQQNWWLTDPLWWDKMLDSPFYPGNYGGGYAWTSLPNDLLIAGSAGYADGTIPYTALHAIKVLAAFYTMRPNSILADVAITPSGGVVNYSQMPAEVQDFIKTWRYGGAQVVSVG